MDNADEVLRWIQRKQDAVEKGMERTHYRIGALVKDTAVKYAPKSPTQAEKKRASNATAAQWKAAKARRKPRSTSRPMPGGLMRSISFRSTPEFAEVFVDANSEAGKYAFIIHEMKGKAWSKRGVGTVAKGSQADDKFISRAIEDKAPEFQKIIATQIRKDLKG